MIGPTGGIQGQSGTLFGFAYQPGSWQDKLIEAYSGTHDMIGGRLSGLYDSQGNTLRERSPTENFYMIVGVRWLFCLLPPLRWQNFYHQMRGMRF